MVAKPAQKAHIKCHEVMHGHGKACVLYVLPMNANTRGNIYTGRLGYDCICMYGNVYCTASGQE